MPDTIEPGDRVAWTPTILTYTGEVTRLRTAEDVGVCDGERAWVEWDEELDLLDAWVHTAELEKE